MFKWLIFSGLLCMLGAGELSAQEVAISGKDLLSGEGDVKLAEIARTAAAAGKTVVVTTPKYWQDKVAGKLHAGAPAARVQMSEGFFENVVVRIEDAKTAKAAETTPKPVETKPVEAKVKPAEVKPKPVAVAEPAPPAAAIKPAQAPVPVEVQPTPVPAAPIVAAPAAVAPAPVAVTPPPAPVHPAAPPPVDPSIAIKERLERNLNNGKPAEGPLQVSQLQKDDQLFVDGPVRAVARHDGTRIQLFWLEGELNLDRTELLPTGNGRYKINEPVRNIANPTLRSGSHGPAQKFASTVPAPGSDVRLALEKQYSDSHDISGSLSPVELRQGDVVYTRGTSAVVVRRAGSLLERYWLTGELDLHQSGLQAQGNAYRVLTDTIK